MEETLNRIKDEEENKRKGIESGVMAEGLVEGIETICFLI